MTTQIFRTPEQVAPEMGITKTELRRYCRESGIYTKLSNRRVMLHEDDVTQLITWIREHKAAGTNWATEATEHDPFA